MIDEPHRPVGGDLINVLYISMHYVMDILRVSIGLILVVCPLVVWSSDRFRRKHAFSDNLIWWVSVVQVSALTCLWVGKFSLYWFMTIFIVISAYVTYIRRLGSSESENEVLLNGLGVGGAVVAGTIIIAIVGPIERYLGVPMGWDALSYHLPMAAQWVQSQSILAHDSRVWFYPGGYELLTAVFFMIVGSDALWFIPDVISWGILVLSLWRLAISLDIDKTTSAFMASSIVITPLFYRSLALGDNDLLVAALVVYLVSSLIRCGVRYSLEAWWVSLISLGVLSSLKYSSMVWLFIGFPYLIHVRKKSRSVFAYYDYFVFALSGFPLLGFLLRNWFLTGNPVYPVGLGGLIPWGDLSHIVSTINAITVEELRSTSIVRHGWRVVGILYVRLAELYWPMWAVPLLMIFGFFGKYGSSNPLPKHKGISFLGLGIIISAFIFVTQPLVVETVVGTYNQILSGSSLRFSLGWVALLSIFLFLRLPWHGSRAVLSVLLFLYMAWTYGHSKSFLVSCFLGLLVIQFTTIWSWIIFVIFLVIASIYSSKNHDLRPDAYSGAYSYGGKSNILRYIDVGSCKNTIVVSTVLRAWPFVGPHLANRVISVGMSSPVSEFKRIIEFSGASVVVTSKGYGSDLSPDYGAFYPDRDRLSVVLGDDWRIGYDDGYATAYVSRNFDTECNEADWNFNK